MVFLKFSTSVIRGNLHKDCINSSTHFQESDFSLCTYNARRMIGVFLQQKQDPETSFKVNHFSWFFSPVQVFPNRGLQSALTQLLTRGFCFHCGTSCGHYHVWLWCINALCLRHTRTSLVAANMTSILMTITTVHQTNTVCYTIISESNPTQQFKMALL